MTVEIGKSMPQCAIQATSGLTFTPDSAKGKKLVATMVSMANLTRTGFMNGDISTVMSPRTVLTWAENYSIFHDVHMAFRLSFLNKCDETERATIAEYYQRCFDVDLLQNAA